MLESGGVVDKENSTLVRTTASHRGDIFNEWRTSECNKFTASS